MTSKTKKVDKFFSIILLSLLGSGVAMFISASLGILLKNREVFYSVIFNQLVLGLGLGLIGMYLTLKFIPYKFLRKYSLFIFLGTLLLTASVFLPNIGWSHGGAERWIKLGPVSFQPVEFLKFGFIIYFAGWLSFLKEPNKSWRYAVLPFVTLIAIIGFVLLNQPDTKSLILIFITGLVMLFMSQIPIRHILILSGGALILAFLLVHFTPYLKDRVQTFLNPSQDAKGESWQVQQSWIAIGSGGLMGRGYGQSIQKFSYLPEAQGDSIFAVIGEEFGFIGSTIVIILYVLFALRGYKIASIAPDGFSRLLVIGIITLITAQSFMHIASVIGVFPLTGVPLVFMSHGGTALMIYLIAVGFVLQISKSVKHPN